MKSNYKWAVFACAALILGACSKDDDEIVNPDPKPDPTPDPTPEVVDDYAYLNDYKALKENLDRTQHPGFKVSGALDVSDYNSKGSMYTLANENFDELVAGNAMKMQSCVYSSGDMNFDRVKEFVSTTEAAGMTIYGHTLLWHSQQPTGWLGSIISGKILPDSPVSLQTITERDYTQAGATALGGWGENATFTVADGAMQLKNSKAGDFWSSQAALECDAYPVDTKVSLKITAKASEAYTFKIFFQKPDGYVDCGDFPDLALTTEYQEFNVETTITGEGGSRILFNFGDIAGTIYIKSFAFSAVTAEKTPLTAQEKSDTLVWAMRKWMNGMMDATAGKVKAWDLINEAIAGNGDVNGYYALQGASNGGGSWDVGGSNFYWQDYLGAENYGVIAEREARNAWAAVEGNNPDDLKLFINDYNLESTWDGNKKLKSLIYWIGVWENGGAKIDGIGTQMHINYYKNETDQNNQKKAITNMFTLMAKTGKLCRVSELDMGYADSQQDYWNGNVKTTKDMTFKMEKQMADYYQWIIEEYFRIIPVEQQYGICQWCITDSPKNSGWRADEPVGLFYLNTLKRKPAYGGWAEGLQK